MAELKLITYKEERLIYFADQRKLVQKRYDRLEKAIKPDEDWISVHNVLVPGSTR